MNDSALAVLNRRALAAFAGLAALILGLGGIAAADANKKGAKIPAQVRVLDGGQLEGQFLVFGKLTSAKKKCRANREVALRVERDGAFELADTARTSTRAGWLLIAPNGGELTAFTIKAKRKRLRNGDVCTRAVHRDGIAQ